MRLTILLLFVLSGPFASIPAQPTSARISAMGGTSTALLDGDDLASNPASWSSADALSLGLSASQLYGMPELRAASARLLIPLRGVSVVAGASTFGFDLYRETGLVLGLARAFRPGTHRSVHVGIRIRHTLIRIPKYAGASYPAVSAGLILPVLPTLSLGAAAENLFVLRSAPEIDRTLALGLSYAHGSRVRVATDFVKEVRTPATVRIGVEVIPVAPLALRAGLTTEPPRASGGIGIQLAHLAVDAAAEHHYVLGWTPVVSVALRW